MLFDSSSTLPSCRTSGRLSKLTIQIAGGGPVDSGLTVALFVDDLASPRATIRLSDLLRQGGERPLNIRRQPSGVVRIVLIDANGVWAAGAPKLEVGLA